MTREDQPAKRAPGRPSKNAAGTPSMRDLVLYTASGLFMRLGYEPVSINMIAESAGVTKASVYYYFPNKAVLFTVSVVEMMRRIRAITGSLLEQPGDLRSRLEKIAAAKLSQSHVDFESMMKEAMSSLSEEQQHQIRMAERAIHEAMAAAFGKAMEEGEMAAGDPMLLSHSFAALLMLGNREKESSGFSRDSELSSEIVRLFWLGAAPR